ncbi:glucan endo-1,3-beta-D-glucosidase-like [Diospyros lotus]|uniref:glucan endo-1,3-beta-D-glucosidase-like n=1 Tax=Diospyros lotus TaxID=55363 RepID=UPI00224F76A2|nr:glucan endo-1,3-beta-D-glucosidase-like [Diospyros lotus]
MANSSTLLFLFIFFLFISGGSIKLAYGQAPGQGAWCVAKPSTSIEKLVANINYACSVVNCSLIRDGGPCFLPPLPMNHASFVMNLYYQEAGRHFWNCDFNSSGVITVTDPSYGNCKFPFNG